MDEDQNACGGVSRATRLGSEVIEFHMTITTVPQRTAETSLPAVSSLGTPPVDALHQDRSSISCAVAERMEGERPAVGAAALEYAAIDIPSSIGSPSSVGAGATPTINVLPTKQRRGSASVFASHGSDPSVTIDVGLPTGSSVSAKPPHGARGGGTIVNSSAANSGNPPSTPPGLDQDKSAGSRSASTTRAPTVNHAATKRMMLLDYSDVEAAFFHGDFFIRRRAAAFLSLVLRANEYAANVSANISHNRSQWKYLVEHQPSRSSDSALRPEDVPALSQHVVQFAIPSQFLDPVTRRVMSDPVVFINKAVLDRPSAEGLVFRLFVTMAKCQAVGSQKRREFFASNPESVVSSSVTRQLFQHVLGAHGLSMVPRPGLLHEIAVWCQACLSQSARLRTAVEDMLLEEVARRSVGVASDTVTGEAAQLIAEVEDTNAEWFALDHGSLPLDKNHTLVIKNLRQSHPQQRACLEHVAGLDSVARTFAPRPWELSLENMWREACEKSVRVRKHTAASRKSARRRRVPASAPSSPSAHARDQPIKPTPSLSTGVLHRSSSGRALHTSGDGFLPPSDSDGFKVADDGGVGGIAVGMDFSSFDAESSGNVAVNELLRKQSSTRRYIEEEMQRELTLLRLLVPPVHHPVVVRAPNICGGVTAAAAAAATSYCGEPKCMRTVAIGVVAVPTAVTSVALRPATSNQPPVCSGGGALLPQKPVRGGAKEADEEGPISAPSDQHALPTHSCLAPKPPRPSHAATSPRVQGAVAFPAGRNHTKPHVPILRGFVVAPGARSREAIEPLTVCGTHGGSSGLPKPSLPPQPLPTSVQASVQESAAVDTVAEIPTCQRPGTQSSIDPHQPSSAIHGTSASTKRCSRWRDGAYHQLVREEFPGALDSPAGLAAAAVHPNPKPDTPDSIRGGTCNSNAPALSLEERSLVSAVMRFHQDPQLFDAVMDFHAPWFLELEARALVWSEATFAAIAEAQERARLASANQQRQRRPTALVHKCSIGYSGGSVAKQDDVSGVNTASSPENHGKAVGSPAAAAKSAGTVTTTRRQEVMDCAESSASVSARIPTAMPASARTAQRQEASRLVTDEARRAGRADDDETKRLSSDGAEEVVELPFIAESSDPFSPERGGAVPLPLQSTFIVPSDLWRLRLQDDKENCATERRFIAPLDVLMNSPRCGLRGTPQSAPGIRLVPPSGPSVVYVSEHAKVLPGSVVVRDPNTEIPAEHLLREQERLYAVYDEAQVRQELRRRRELGMYYFEPIMASDERQRVEQERHETVRKNLSAASAKSLKVRWEAALRQGGDRDVLQAESNCILFVDLPNGSSDLSAAVTTDRSRRPPKGIPVRPFSSTLSARSWVAACQPPPPAARSCVPNQKGSLGRRLATSSPSQQSTASRKFHLSMRIATKYDKELENSSPLLPKAFTQFE